MPDMLDITSRLLRPPKKPNFSRARSLLSTGFIILMLGLIGFAVYQVARHVTVGLNTLRTQEITDQSYVSLELYVFRDETPLSVEGGDVYLYAVEDGERVGVSQTVGIPYHVGDPAVVAELQTKLNAYGDRVSLLRKLGGTGTPADARDAAEDVDRAYQELLDAASAGDLSAVSGFADSMQNGIGRYDILTGAASQSISSLEAQRQALLAGYAALSPMTMAKSGYFYYTCDGYESLFAYDMAETMSPAEFRELTTLSAQGIPSGVAGKLVTNTVWYAAAYVPLSNPAVELFQQGIASQKSYVFTCRDRGGVELTLTLKRLVPDGDGVLLVFSSQDMPEGFDFPRSFTAETIALSTGGYRIPTEALVTLRSRETGEDVTGVYILAGNVVEFRKISIYVRRDGYVIAETYEDVKAYLDGLSESDPEEYARRTADEWSFLGLNDNIITGGNELYEGKVIG